MELKPSTVLLSIILTFSMMPHAQIYKWTDKNGNVHFGDNPPENVEANPVSQPTGPSEEESEQARKKFQEQLDRRSQLERQDEGTEPSPDLDDNAWKYAPVLPASCRSYPRVSQNIKFDSATARDLFRKLVGNWSGTITRFECETTVTNLPKKCEQLPIAGSALGEALKNGTIKECARIAAKNRRVSETVTLSAKGQIKVSKGAEADQNLLLSSLIDPESSEPVFRRHYLAVFDSLHYLPRGGQSLSDDWPSLRASGNRVGVKSQTGNSLAFAYSRPSVIKISGTGFKHRVPGYNEQLLLYMSNGKFAFVQADRPAFPTRVTVWELSK